jgi:hypothetical protein
MKMLMTGFLPVAASQIPVFVMLGLLFVGGAVAVWLFGRKRPAV